MEGGGGGTETEIHADTRRAEFTRSQRQAALAERRLEKNTFILFRTTSLSFPPLWFMVALRSVSQHKNTTGKRAVIDAPTQAPMSGGGLRRAQLSQLWTNLMMKCMFLRLKSHFSCVLADHLCK